MSGNCYARALGGLRECSVYWSMVGLYYTSFFALKAVLGMHGCWINGAKRWIEVTDSTPGNQKLAYRTIVYPNNGGKTGSHQIAWIAFYEAMNHLAGWFTGPNAALAITPVNANRTWMIDTRNDVNYDPVVAFDVMDVFRGSFDPTNLPNCFSGKLQTMFQMAQAFVLFSKELAINLSLNTDVCDPIPLRKDWWTHHVTSPQHVALTAFAATENPKLDY